MIELPIEHWLVIVSVVISLFGATAYIRETLKGTTKPNRVSWAMWASAPLIGTFAAIDIKADIWATARVFLAGFLPLLVFIASFTNRKSYWTLSAFDFACGALSVLALFAWLAVDSPRLAILLAATGDGLAALPTITKAWRYPETETGSAYIASFISLVLVVPSIPVWNIENSAFQVYLLIANTVLVFAVYRKKINAVITNAFNRSPSAGTPGDG